MITGKIVARIHPLEASSALVSGSQGIPAPTIRRSLFSVFKKRGHRLSLERDGSHLWIKSASHLCSWSGGVIDYLHLKAVLMFQF